MFHAPMKTIVTFSIVAVLIVLLFASGHIQGNQQIYAVNTGNVGHLYEGGIPGYPYFGGYPNYGGHPYITGYGHRYDTGLKTIGTMDILYYLYTPTINHMVTHSKVL
jgi:hypothetical protein